jgi:hypothetical protein
MSGHDGMAGLGVGLCLLLASAVVAFVAPRKLEAPARTVALDPGSVPLSLVFTAPLDRRARASPSELQRFRN